MREVESLKPLEDQASTSPQQTPVDQDLGKAYASVLGEIYSLRAETGEHPEWDGPARDVLEVLVDGYLHESKNLDLLCSQIRDYGEALRRLGESLVVLKNAYAGVYCVKP